MAEVLTVTRADEQCSFDNWFIKDMLLFDDASKVCVFCFTLFCFSQLARLL